MATLMSAVQHLFLPRWGSIATFDEHRAEPHQNSPFPSQTSKGRRARVEATMPLFKDDQIMVCFVHFQHFCSAIQIHV